jgi:hypothetical protein
MPVRDRTLEALVAEILCPVAADEEGAHPAERVVRFAVHMRGLPPAPQVEVERLPREPEAVRVAEVAEHHVRAVGVRDPAPEFPPAGVLRLGGCDAQRDGQAWRRAVHAAEVEGGSEAEVQPARRAQGAVGEHGVKAGGVHRRSGDAEVAVGRVGESLEEPAQTGVGRGGCGGCLCGGGPRRGGECRREGDREEARGLLHFTSAGPMKSESGRPRLMA